MKHINKCEKCGKEYNPEIKMDTEETPKCDFCGALDTARLLRVKRMMTNILLKRG